MKREFTLKSSPPVKRKLCGGCRAQIRGLTVVRDGAVILSPIDLDLFCGQLLAVIGPNGGGKTTLIKALLGQIKHGGTVTYLKGGRQGPLRTGYVPQALEFDRLTPMTVGDFIACATVSRPVFWGIGRQKSNIEQILCETGAQGLLQKSMGVLSGGELQRVLLALALYGDPHLLLLDEPVSGVDAKGLMDFYGLLDQIKRERDVSIVLITHDLGRMRAYADRVALIDGGLRVCGEPDRVFESEEFKRAFGVLPWRS